MSALWRFLGLDKVTNFMTMIKQNGGIKNTVSILYRTDTFKKGELVGTDEFGNQYFENNEYTVPKNRWVVYSKRVYLDYDGSQVPAPWHRWLHHITEKPPSIHPPEERRWMMPHEENKTGTSGQYMPYSTTRPKIDSWHPSQQQQKRS